MRIFFSVVRRLKAGCIRRGQSSRVWGAALLLLAALGSGCIWQSGRGTPAAEATATASAVASPASTQSPEPVVSPTPSGPVMLTVWLPPEFDPAADTPAGTLLRERLAAFEQRRPHVRVQIRIKATTGAGGMMQSVSAAAAAAPGVLPNVMLVPQDVLETGVLKGLFYPFDNLISLTESDWFDFTLQPGQSQGSVFGIPFVADALVMAYRPDKITEPPADWSALMETPAPLLFAGADADSLYPLVLYLSSGGMLQDEAGRPVLQAAPLTTTLTRLDEAHRIGRFPVYLLQYTSPEMVWQAYQNETAAMSIVWLSDVLQHEQQGSALALLPTPTGAPVSLGRTWLWVMPSAQNQALSAELATYLTLPEFMAGWSEAAGYLPARNSALALWQQSEQKAFLSQLVQATRPLPPVSVRTVLSPLLSAATEQILQEKSTPEEAANMILEKLSPTP